jgi:2-methylisocitrate lyase-like PEP mutase family enzyme
VVNIFEGGKTPFVSADELGNLGFKLAIYPSQTHRSAIWAVRETLAAMRGSGSSAAVLGQMVSFADREVAVRTALWNALDQRYGVPEEAQ